MIEPGGELRLTAEALHDFRVPGERRMEHLERDLALQVQVAHP